MGRINPKRHYRMRLERWSACIVYRYGIGAWTKRPTFCKHVQIHLFEITSFWMLPNFVPTDPIYVNSVLVQVMASILYLHGAAQVWAISETDVYHVHYHVYLSPCQWLGISSVIIIYYIASYFFNVLLSNEDHIDCIVECTHTQTDDWYIPI